MNFDSFDNDYNDLNSCMMLPESTSLDDIVLNSQRAMMRNDQRKRSIFVPSPATAHQEFREALVTGREAY